MTPPTASGSGQITLQADQASGLRPLVSRRRGCDVYQRLLGETLDLANESFLDVITEAHPGMLRLPFRHTHRVVESTRPRCAGSNTATSPAEALRPNERLLLS